MRKSIHRLLHCFLAMGLSLSCAATLAVPKAAEHEDGEVTFGEAVGAPPKPTAKLATQPVSKGSKAAGQPVAKGVGKPTGKKTGSAKPARAASSSTARTPPPTKPAEKAKPKGKAGKK